MKRTLLIFWIFSSCSRQDTNHHSLMVNNGVGIDDHDLPSVILIKTSGFICTGTKIAEDIVMTAAHCVQCELKQTKTPRPCLANEMDASGIAVKKIIQHPDYVKSIGADFTNKDLAFLILEQPLTVDSAKICNHAPRIGSEVLIVGYGADDFYRGPQPRKGGKYIGSNYLSAINAGGLIVEGPRSMNRNTALGTGATANIGDSGGPLFDKNMNCVLGVTSGFLHDVENGKIINAYANLWDETNRSLLQQARRSSSIQHVIAQAQ